jgi:hypothetical protein
MKPPLTVDLTAPEGNVFALVGKATATLEQSGQPVQAKALREWFRTVAPLGDVSYDGVRRMVEQYCDVTWVNEPRPPEHTNTMRQMLSSMSSGLGPDSYPGARVPFLITYDYTESGATEWCGFICHAETVQGAAESFWNQHPGEWFRLISVNDGTTEYFWQPQQATFVTVPERETELE